MRSFSRHMPSWLTPELRMQTHFVLETLAFFVGFRYFLYLRKQQGDLISERNRLRLIIATILGALIGSRLLGALEDWSSLMASSNLLLHIYASKTVLGGLLGGLWTVELAKWRIGEKKSSGDLFTFPLILGLIIGRIGCFICGVYEPTHGVETDFFLGMDLGDGKMRHPVALYEIAFLLLLWIGIVQTEKRLVLGNGQRFRIFMISYLIFRLVLDFIKPRHTYLWELGSIQVAALVGLAYYAVEKKLRGL